MATLRHDFYETDEKITLSIFDRGADPSQVSVQFAPRSLTYENGDKKLVLQLLKGEIDPSASDFSVGKFKVEIRLIKKTLGRWKTLEGDSPDPLAPPITPSPATSSEVPKPKPHKNWERITDNILTAEKDPPLNDPNAGGDTAVNEFFSKLFQDANADTRRAMMKSYSESGGTTLSTNWDEVGKGKVEVKPPQGSEWKKWGE